MPCSWRAVARLSPAPAPTYRAAAWWGFSPYRSTAERVNVAPRKSGNGASSTGAWTEANQEATAVSYAAVCAKACAAKRRRCSSVVPPAARSMSSAAYAAGSTTTATDGWFFAADRTIAGPPMSICSMHSSGPAPDATVAVNGYRLTTTSSNGATPRSWSCCAWAGSRRSARMPACTLGCSVLTRPSRHSGKPVSASTAVTGTPASRSRAAVDPVETSSTPAACSPWPSSTRPVLS